MKKDAQRPELPARWDYSPAPAGEVRNLAADLSCSPALAEVLWKRGYREAGAAGSFLDPRLARLSDPHDLPGIREAAGMLVEAAAQGLRITIYSDYDVDGLTSCALLLRCLRAAGAAPAFFLPDRMSEGYGLSFQGMERCLRQTRPELLVVLDCGTNSRAEIDELRGRGVRTIVVDHHEPENAARPDAMINPKAAASSQKSDYSYLCTAGLVFKLCHALLKASPEAASKFDLKRSLDLVGLGTVADIVPLVGENRILVRHGLRQMCRSGNIGLGSLQKVSGMTGEATVYDCGFRLGPRLNAAGRLESAVASLELLITEDAAAAFRIASELDGLNRERRALQEAIYRQAAVIAQERVDRGDRVLVVGGNGWHSGVVGIVAAKLSQKYHRPSFVVSIDEAQGLGKGSGRSIPGVKLVDALHEARGLLVSGGGHAMAVGVTLEAGRLEEFTRKMNSWAALQDEALWNRRLAVDLELSLDQVRYELLQDLERMEPFGQGNPPVLIALRGARVGSFQRVGEGKKHLSMILEGGGARLRSIFFQYDERPDPKSGAPVDAVVELQRDQYRGNAQIQARIVDLIAARD